MNTTKEAYRFKFSLNDLPTWDTPIWIVDFYTEDYWLHMSDSDEIYLGKMTAEMTQEATTKLAEKIKNNCTALLDESKNKKK